jgi:hypothetical protein
MAPAPRPAPSLGGELGLLSLFDLGQLLLLNGASGELCVTRDGRRGYLYFDRGQVVNAVDDEYHEGDGAAYGLFTWKTGTFEFRAGAHTGARAVTESTEALMLEAARRMDELGLGEEGEAAKLKQRASALDALREAFQSVARETGADRPAEGADGSSPFARLAGPADALLLRPGRAPRVRRGGAWADAGGAPLDLTAFEQLRARLLDTPGTAARDGMRAATATGEDGRRYAVARFAGEHEALWVRLAEVPPPALASLPGGDAVAAQLEGASGLLVAGASDAEAADRFFHVLVAHLAATRRDSVLLVAEGGRWALPDGTGALLRASGRDAEAALRACTPGVAAYDTAHAGLSAAALGAAPLVVACAVAPTPEALLAAWGARAGRHSGEPSDTLLETLGVTLAHAGGGGEPRLTLVPAAFGPPASATRPSARRAA